MKIISINAGSSSLKFSLFNMKNREVLASGLFERIGLESSFYTIKYHGEEVKEEIDLPDAATAAEILLDRLITLNIVESLDEISGIGHRIVSGGEKYTKSVRVTDEVIQDLIDLKDFAPLHNPGHVAAIQAFKQVLPDVPMVCVFDTAFHQTMDPVRYLYPIPYDWYQKYGVRKYGAHGTSYRYVSSKIAEELGRKDLRVIICHLGSGASIAAVKDGKCIDTSMGFTPLAGVMMGTRSGDIDCSFIPYVMEKEGLNAGEVISALNKQSGLLGVSQTSSDMRDIINGMNNGNEQCKLAFDMYVRRAVSYIANYYVELGGVDVICFTAGIGERSFPTRKAIVEQLTCLGITLDESANEEAFATFSKISGKDSKIPVYVVPTDEELMIAMDTLALI